MWTAELRQQPPKTPPAGNRNQPLCATGTAVDWRTGRSNEMEQLLIFMVVGFAWAAAWSLTGRICPIR